MRQMSKTYSRTVLAVAALEQEEVQSAAERDVVTAAVVVVSTCSATNVVVVNEFTVGFLYVYSLRRQQPQHHQQPVLHLTRTN